MGSGIFHDHIVPGLDLFIGDPEFLMPTKNTKLKAKMLHVPSYYTYRILDFYHENTTRGEACRLLTARLGWIAERMNKNNSDVFVFDNGMKLTFQNPPHNTTLRGLERSPGEEYSSSKSHAITIAKFLQERYGKENVSIMTGSDQLATLAAFNKIDVSRINPEVYTGRIKVDFPDDFASHWWTNHSIPKRVWDDLFPHQPLVINQYVEMMFNPSGQTDSYYQNIGRFDGEAIVPLRSVRISDPTFNKIKPKTPGQAMLFDALLAPVDELPIVIAYGTFGTGKTFCAVAAALAQVIDQQYDRVFVCPRDGALGREIGFLKGGKEEKILPQAAPIFDNLNSVVKLLDIKTKTVPEEVDPSRKKKGNCNTPPPTTKTLAEEYRKTYFEVEPIIYMGGRSIEDSFMIYDEFQDMERGQARALLSRIGNGSKVVVLGDPNQTTNPHLNKTSNGLSYSASKLAGDPLAAVISFDETREVVRSPAAKHIAERLSSSNFVNT